MPPREQLRGDAAVGRTSVVTSADSYRTQILREGGESREAAAAAQENSAVAAHAGAPTAEPRLSRAWRASGEGAECIHGRSGLNNTYYILG